MTFKGDFNGELEGDLLNSLELDTEVVRGVVWIFSKKLQKVNAFSAFHNKII